MKQRTFSRVLLVGLFLALVLVYWSLIDSLAQSPQIFGGKVPQAGQSLTGIIWPRADTVFLDTENHLYIRRACGNRLDVVPVVGLSDTLIGIDFRVSDGKLYGVGDSGRVYTIDEHGNGSPIAFITPSFSGDIRSLVDFNPAAPGVPLRLIGANDMNYALTGATLATTVPQTGISYAQGDANAGRNPNISGGAYSNNVAGATTTILYALDYVLNTLVSPIIGANGSSNTAAGVFQTIGVLIGPNGKTFDLDAGADLDVYTINGQNRIIGVNGKSVFTVSLPSLQVRAIPLLPDTDFIDIAVGSPKSCDN